MYTAELNNFDFVGDLEGEAIRIDDNGDDDTVIAEFDCETVYFVPITEPSLFKAVYNSIDEIITEVKQLCQGKLPDDFDYRANLCHIIGTYYCD